MIDPRFANAGAMPFAPGYGAQQVPMQYHRHHHHRHHKTKHGSNGDSPLSRDESIHKVADHDHHHHQQQNGNVPFSGGYGVPYGTDGFAAGSAGGYYQQQQQQFAGGNYGFNNQYQGNAYDQGQFGGDQAGATAKHRRRHHRHHRHDAAEIVVGSDHAAGVPEQLIGQRSSSVIDNNGAAQVRSSAPPAENDASGVQEGHHRHRHHHRRRSGENAGFGQTHQSRQTQGHTSAGADGYGHINDDLIFIERGDHSPHRQEPPPGYEYKGKIEVQGIDKEYRSQFHGQGSIGGQGPTSVPMPYSVGPHPIGPHPVGPHPVGPPASLSHCPPGWQQIILSAAPGGPCPPGVPCGAGGIMYTGQLIGGAGMAQAGFGGIGGIGGFGGSAAGMGFGGVGPIGAPGSGGGLANLAASLPFPPQGQLVADYIVESSAGGISSSGGSGFSPDYQQQTSGSGVGSGGSFAEQHHGEHISHGEHTEQHTSSRATIIEVWQKRSKSDGGYEGGYEGSRSRSPTRPGSAFDFERFRKDILGAIERVAQTGGTGSKMQWTGHDGGTQTQIHPTTGYEDKKQIERRTIVSGGGGGGGGGEVRVIVQPIQPVFYMPRQNETRPTVGPPMGAGVSVGPGPAPVAGPGPAPAIQQASSGGANVIYIPRNVYVPVIKPVFVPRERVIVRPQVIHVARPVLVDRPVPVTQRPIIIDRERPIAVPVRGGGQGVVHTESSRSVREEQAYQENLPVAYEGSSTAYTAGANYDYAPTQQEQQYAASSSHEVAGGYETQVPNIDVQAQEQYQHTQVEEQYQHTQAPEQYQHIQAEQYQQTQAPEQYQHIQAEEQYQESQSNTQFNVQQSADSYRESHTNLIKPISAMAGVAHLHCTEPIPIDLLDATVSPNWQRTDRQSLVNRYGRPAYDIVQRTDQVEQQMYQELRQRNSSGNVQRSDSAASYGSGSGAGIHSDAGFAASSASFSSGHFDDMQNFDQQGFTRQRSTSRTVCINY